MAGNFDDIIREVLGMQQRGANNAQLIVPEGWKRSVPPGPRMNEGDMPPMTMEQEFAHRNWPATPIPNNNVGPPTSAVPIPSNSPEFYVPDPQRQTGYQQDRTSPMQKILQSMGLATPSVEI